MLTEQSAGAMGRAYAGVGVDGLDISGTYYNPATMALHQGTKMQAGFVHIGVNAEYQSSVSNASENGRLKSQTIPHGYITHQISDGMWAGLAMTVPWGLGTDYGSRWEGADHGTAAKMRSFDFNPNLAWKLTDKLTVGAGVSLQYVAATLKVGRPGGGFGTEYKADSTDWGFNVGAMWEPADNLRFGISYRSEVKHHTEGFFAKRQAGSPELKADATLDVSGPAWAMATAAWDVSDLLSLYATFRWTDWSSFKELDFKAGPMPVPSIQNHWRDAYLGSVGADYRMNDRWTIRGGIGYETTPIDNPHYRTSVIPDADRWWFAVGSTYKFSDRLQTDVSLAWLHGVHERSLYKTDGSELGRYDKLDAYLFGFQLVYAF